ncbi:MAG: DUF998 domain-containing protein [Cyclobacteriaceae bacterium]|nr:DUF998 domain-containing protein [Cyclobacteriaceae bacterium]
MAFPILIALTGISFILCGIFQQDPAPGYDPEGLELTTPTLQGLIHLFFAGVCALCAVFGLLIMAQRFAKHSTWHAWRTYSLFMTNVLVIFVIIYAIWSRASSGFAGMFERFALMIVPTWSLTFLYRLEKGIPFMFSRVSQEENKN